MQEQRLIIISIAVTFFFSVFGIVWGILADSSMITFDGTYSLISVGLSGLSLIVLKLVAQSSESVNSKFPFGKAHFEPMLIVFKSLTLIGMCAYSSAGAVSDIISGGAPVDPGPAILYAGISTVGCAIIAFLLRERNRQIGSAILEAEKNQWVGDLLLSLGVLAGFTAALLLKNTQWGVFVDYADPVMVLVASNLFIFLPLKSMLAAGKEMMLVKTNNELRIPIEIVAAEYAQRLNATYKLRMVSIGRELNIELNFIMPPNDALTVKDMDTIRSDIAKVADTLKSKHWINVSFTSDPAWA
ncbi:hypothetical protein C9J01_08665 [Photobacterium rosenbergii]|uniref:Cation efflux protein transmembrane domain-containing protein n=1 Tax=Photobacterium rosenbergii TaxID=294936 RepID=A0A2T3NHJ7_9GAMM|nr:cation transporter [Photobacterium rosenbergii]PSW14494.1 hypothetical protein C9J01_08665 [Photobacterium rosenbergii]